MKKLERPTCNIDFNSYIRRGNTWNLLNDTSDKTVIKLLLLGMSNNRCSYCENEVEDSTSHIEHLARRTNYPTKTFEWDNLFCSCNSSNTCGSYKDNIKKYAGNSSDLIKPDRDEPSDFMQINRLDGSFYAIENNDKALNTIDFFNLNAPQLTRFRLNFINITKQITIDYEELITECTDYDDLKGLYEDMMDEVLGNYEESGVDKLGFIQMLLKNFQHLLHPDTVI